MDGSQVTQLPADDPIGDIVRAIAPVLARLRDELNERVGAVEATFNDQMAQATAHMREAVAATRERAEDAIRQTADAVRALAEQVSADSRAMPDRLLHQISLMPRPRDGRDGYLNAVAEFQEGRVYEAGECAFAAGGTWQAVTRTNTPPHPDDRAWRCITVGIQDFVATQGEDPRSITWGNRLSTGVVHETTVPLPIPLHRGAFAGDVTYTRNDLVAFDGCSWICVAETATTPPPSDDWRLVAQRGGRGKQGDRGAQGPRGEQGPQGRDGAIGQPGARGERGLPGPRIIGTQIIEPGLIRLAFEDETVSQPINVGSMRFVGIYEPGATYQKGDIVRLGFHLWIAQRETATVPRAPSEDWALLLPGNEPGPSGSGGLTGGLHYLGIWQVAANNPDLITADSQPGDYYTCTTDDPAVPEIADPAIPGIGGQTISNGDWIIFDQRRQWDHLSGGGMTKPEADALYVKLVGDTMTGPLIVQDDPTAHVDIIGDQFSLLNFGRNNEPRWILGASHFVQADHPHGLYFARMSADGSAIVDFPFWIERGNGHVHLGDTEVFGARTENLIPRTDDELVCKLYVDDAIANADLDQYVRKVGDTMTGNLTLTIAEQQRRGLRIVGTAPFADPQVALRLDLFDLEYAFETRSGGAFDQLGLNLRRYSSGVQTMFMRVPVAEDHLDMLRPRTFSGDATDPNDLVRLAQVNAIVGDIDRFVHKAGDDLTGPLRWDTPALGEALNIRHGVIRIIGGAIDVQDDGGFGSEVRANWFVVPTDGRGLAFGTLGQDGGLYKAVGDGLRLRESSGGQRITVESNDGGQRWQIIDQRGGEIQAGLDFYREGTASVGGQTLQWHDDTSLQARIYGTRYAASNDLGGFLIQLWRPDTAAWQTGLRVRQSTADPLPRVELAADPLLPLDAATRQYVDRLASGAPHFIGTVDAATGQCSYTPNSGHPDGPLIDPADAASGAFLICTNGGNHASLPDPMDQGDWLVTDGNTWTVLQIGAGAISAGNVALQPPVFGQPNVQLALQQTETRVTINEAETNNRVLRSGDTMTNFLSLHADPTLPLHASTRRYVDTALQNLRLPVWTQGASYLVGQTVLYDNRAFRVVTAINNAPATPDFTTITPTGYGQSDYWEGAANLTNWTAGNWAYICDLPPYGAYRIMISDLHSGNDTSLVLDVTTGFNAAEVTIAGYIHQGTGSWSAVRLVQNGNAPAVIALLLEIAILNATPNFKIVVTGEARGTVVNGVRIQKPLTASATGAAGTARATIRGLQNLAIGASGALRIEGSSLVSRINSIGTNNRATLSFGSDTADHFHIFRNNGGTSLGLDRFPTDGGAAVPVLGISRATGEIGLSAGLSFGSVAQAAATDLSRHLMLWGTSFGFSITSGTLNYVVPVANQHDFHCGTNHVARLNNASGLVMQGNRDVTARSFISNVDNQGFATFAGGWFYKATGTGLMIRCSTGNQQPQIEDNSGATNTRRFILDSRNTQTIAEPTTDGHIATRGYVNGRFISNDPNAIRLTASARAYPRIRSEGADAGIGNDPPTLRANSNSIHVSNANFPNNGIVFLPPVNYLQHGEAFFFESEATFNLNIQSARTSMTAALAVATGNTAVFVNNRRTNVWDYVGTMQGSLLPQANKINMLDLAFTLPANRGTNGQVLTSNGSGSANWSNPSVPAAGAWETHTASTAFTATIYSRSRLILGGAFVEFEYTGTPLSGWTTNVDKALLLNPLPVGKRPARPHFIRSYVVGSSGLWTIINTDGTVVSRLTGTEVVGVGNFFANFTYSVAAP